MVLLSVSCLALTGCNLFGWTSGDSSDSLIDNGIQKMRDGNYQGAVADFSAAMEDDPNSSEARYYHAKATLLASGFNPFNIGVEISEGSYDAGEDLPFTGINWPEGKANSLYGAVRTVYDDLKPIYYEETHGEFTKKEIDLDFAVATGVKGIFGFQDMNLDGVINASDFKFHLTYYGDQGYGFGQNDIVNYLSGAGGVPKPIGPFDLDTCALIDTFNLMLDNIATIINESRVVIHEIIAELDEDSELDPADIDEFLQRVIDIGHYWKINDPADNDLDGRFNEELINGVDDDGDGFYDEDSHWNSCP
jgi:hypothetical protein